MSGRVSGGTAALALVLAVAGVIGVFPGRPAEAYVERVALANQRFNPARVQIQLGDTVIWAAGDDGHTVTARDGSFDSSSRGVMAEGDQFRWRFRVPGTFAYFCRVHQNRGMQGEVVVVDPGAPPATKPLTPVTAAATTSTTAPATVTTLPVTTTSRPLATSSTTSLRQATNTTVPGAPAEPQEAPALNSNAPVLTGAGTSVLPEAQAAARRAEAEKDPLPLLAVVAVAVLALFGGVVGLRAHRRGSSG